MHQNLNFCYCQRSGSYDLSVFNGLTDIAGQCILRSLDLTHYANTNTAVIMEECQLLFGALK